MTDIDEIIAGLSEAQKAALRHKNAGGCSYGWASLQTLDALGRRGVVSRKRSGPGEMFSPQTTIQWPLTAKGRAVRARLLGD